MMENTKNVRDCNKDPSALWKWKWTGSESDASDNLLVWRLVFRCSGWSGDSSLIPLFCLLLLR
ncbi:hypothetical protein F2Q69_00003776 [Brassica cretica]|uniref:Uncharacterized protein n=2 Tax=Brassica cretica TaxID=69181 RepID=A0A8S9PG86_BRACR|nr:hypothetical protein F2Q69_00003776 [Brassica cretica]KAF3548948.1 hypothetical protein DY000_02004544 [Brassica cretica]